MDAQKKPYTPPTVTNFGNVVEKTKGLSGNTWESYMPKPFVWEDLRPSQ